MTRRKVKRYEREPQIREVSAEVRLAKKPHTLKCGCTLKAGLHYGRIAVIMNGSFVAEKHHLSGLCIERLH